MGRTFSNTTMQSPTYPPPPTYTEAVTAHSGRFGFLTSRHSHSDHVHLGSIPYTFPSGTYCIKCKNTGYKALSGKLCIDCLTKHYLIHHSYNPNSDLSFRYPSGFICKKCENTGKKSRNGKPCKDCYEMFDPSHPSYKPRTHPYLLLTSILGDPIMNDSWCGLCRGSGVVWNHLVEDPCPVCDGQGSRK